MKTQDIVNDINSNVDLVGRLGSAVSKDSKIISFHTKEGDATSYYRLINAPKDIADGSLVNVTGVLKIKKWNAPHSGAMRMVRETHITSCKLVSEEDIRKRSVA